MIKFHFDVGGCMVEVTGDTANEALERSALFSNLPEACPLCQAKLRFFYRKIKGFDFYGLVCQGAPSHECNFGIAKEGRKLFYKGRKSWHESFKAFDDSQSEHEEEQQAAAPKASAPAKANPGKHLDTVVADGIALIKQCQTIDKLRELVADINRSCTADQKASLASHVAKRKEELSK